MVTKKRTMSEMTPDEYVKSIIGKYALYQRPASVTNAVGEVYKVIQQWAGQYLLDVTYSGSSAKGTAIRGIADVDLFISLKSETPESLSEIYNKLAAHPGIISLKPRKQNVSIGITCGGHSIDLIPAKKQSGNTTDHSIYRRKANTWTQTNVDKHIDLIRNSGRLDEIRAMKIWRARHGLDFPSFYLELTVINALKGQRSDSVASNVWAVLEYLRDKFATAVVMDPANSNNRLSDDLTQAEKKAIADKAASSLKEKHWEQILW